MIAINDLAKIREDVMDQFVEQWHSPDEHWKHSDECERNLNRLAEMLGVSRPSLREALIALEVEGRVEIRMGSGIYLGAGAGRTILLADAEGPLELLEARAIIESAIVGELAPHATPALIARLDDNMRAMAAAQDDTPLAIRIDGEFHDLIASG